MRKLPRVTQLLGWEQPGWFIHQAAELLMYVG